MKFEDLFKAKQPENYVEYPPKTQPSLEKFFADRANLPAKKAATPLHPQEVQQIKKEYSTAAKPELTEEMTTEPDPASGYMQEPIPANMESASYPKESVSLPIPQQARNLASSYGIEDMKRIKEMANELSPKMGFGDYVANLSPLLVEALFGGGEAGGVSAGIAGENILKGIESKEKRRQTIEDKLLELDKTRMLRKPGSGLQTKSVRNKITGEVEIANFDPMSGYLFTPTGEALNPDEYEYTSGLSPAEYNRRAEKMTAEIKSRGEHFGRGWRIDPTTGLLVRVKNGEILPLQKIQGLNPKQEKDLSTVVEKFRSSDLFKKSEAALIDAGSARDLLRDANSGNSAAASLARTKLARMSGEVGSLSDRDIENAGGSPSFRRKAQRFANLQATGVPLSATDIRELTEVAKIYENNARKNILGAIPGLEQDYLQRGGVKGAVAKSLAGYLPKNEMSDASSIYPKTLYKGGKKVTVSNAEEEKEARSDKWLPKPSGGR